MTTAEPQSLKRVDEFLHPHRSNSDESTNAHLFAQRSTSPTVSTIADKNQTKSACIPPPAPSPPSLSSRLPAVPSPPPLSFRKSPSSTAFDRTSFNSMAVHNVEPQSQWLFSDEDIQNSPSVLDGITSADESVRRAKGVNFIIQAGILLKLPQMTLGTAAVFFHRFYMRFSMAHEKGNGGIHHYNIAATALFLASKAEETCRKTKEIVIAVAKVAQKNSSLIIDEQSKEFWRWKDSILMYEETMLESLTFDVVLDSPYNLLYNFLQQIDAESNKALRNVSWAFLNDSFMTILCLLMPTKDIAVAALYFAAKFNKMKLPDVNGNSWWIALNGVPDRIFKAIDVMADFYTDNPLKKSDNPYDQAPENGMEDLEGTRLRAESVSPNSRLRAEQAEDLAEREEEAHLNGAANGVGKEGNDKSGIDDDRNSTAGDDDAQLKIIANDPATHDDARDGDASYNCEKTNGAVLKSPTKRKDSDDDEASEPKRTKLDNEEESEEGEVDG